MAQTSLPNTLRAEFEQLRAAGVPRPERSRRAATQLQALGIRPTVRAVRAVLGGGSASDICRDLRASTRPDPDPRPAPALDVTQLADAIARRLVALQPVAPRTPLEELARLADAVDGQMRFVTRQVDDTRAIERSLREEIASLRQQLADANLMAATLRQATGTLRAEVATLQRKLQELPTVTVSAA